MMKLNVLQQLEVRGKYVLNSAITIKCQQFITPSFQSLAFLLPLSQVLASVVPFGILF